MPKPATTEDAPDQIADSRLIFALAHDLRTHLRTVVTRIQLVQAGGGTSLPDEDQSMLREAAAAAGDISGLLTAMVAYCDANAGEGAMDLRLMLRGILIELKAKLAAAGAVVEGSNDLDVPIPTGVQSVLKELLTNACKFRDPARPLRIHISSRILAENRLEIAVSDNGIGVAPVYLEKIFVPFRRLHSREEYPGHGLGLATCRRIAAVSGGTIVAEAGPDGGLTVRVTVPLDQQS